MNRFIMANSQQCLGCHACEIACVMAHNDEQHFIPELRLSNINSNVVQ